MQIATSTPTISTQPTISALAVYREGRSAVLHIARRLPILSDKPCTSQVNLVCLQILIVKGGEESAPGWRVDMGVTEARGLLVESSENGLDRQQMQARFDTVHFGLRAQGIAHTLAQHLITAADAQRGASSLHQSPDMLCQPLLPQPRQIEERIFRAWQNNQIWPCRKFIWSGCHVQTHQ